MKTFRSISSTSRRNCVRLGVQTLEARDVPATVLDLTTIGAR